MIDGGASFEPSSRRPARRSKTVRWDTIMETDRPKTGERPQWGMPGSSSRIVEAVDPTIAVISKVIQERGLPDRSWQTAMPTVGREP